LIVSCSELLFSVWSFILWSAEALENNDMPNKGTMLQNIKKRFMALFIKRYISTALKRSCNF